MAKPIPEMPSSVFVTLVGRPNVGKSSLTNYLVGEKVAIVTKKPQTTRSRITGVITKGPVQYVLMDTPGIHAARNKLDARMTQTAAASLKDVDVTMMLFEPAGEFTDAELTMVKALQKGGPAIAVINKVLESEGGTITIHGCAGKLHTPAAPLHGHNDHRVVMSLTVLALAAGLPLSIDDAEAVQKSWPHFFEAIKPLGAEVEYAG